MSSISKTIAYGRYGMQLQQNQGERPMPTFNGFCIASNTKMFHPQGLFYVKVGRNDNLLDILFPEFYDDGEEESEIMFDID
jgi:hypothetical protein